MTEERLLQHISWSSVLDAMKVTPAPEMEYEEAFRCVVKLAGRWGPRDFGRVLEVEVHKEDSEIHGWLDLVLKSPREIVDWKTAGALDARWRQRVRNSWQHDWYGTILSPCPKTFSYRGIMRNGRMAEERIELFQDMDCRVWNQADAVLEMMRSCIKARIPGRTLSGAWPKTKPGACGAYGRACGYLPSCERNDEPPTPPSVDLLPSLLSVSSMDLFLLCPERWRREKIEEAERKEKEHTEATLFGTLTHTGIAEVYRQIIKLQEKENT